MKMPILSRDGSTNSENTVKKLAINGAFLSSALMLSFLENVLLPISFLPFFPGAKLGLANAVILLCVCICGVPSAVMVSLSRIVLSFLLFGSVTSLIYSLIGGMLSLFAVIFLVKLKNPFSFCGISLISAAFHNIGQIFAAYILIGSATAFLMLPWMLVSSQICGLFTGIIINLIYPKTVNIIKRTNGRMNIL